MYLPLEEGISLLRIAGEEGVHKYNLKYFAFMTYFRRL